MKKLLAIIVLGLCFITSTYANDISDFQIEGISVGDSLLKHFKKSEIKKNEYFLEQAKENDNEEFIKDLNDKLKRQIDGTNQETVIVDKGIKDREELRKQARQKEKAEEEKERSRRLARAQQRRAKREAEERKLKENSDTRKDQILKCDSCLFIPSIIIDTSKA